MELKLAVFDIAGTTMDDREDTVSAAFLKTISENGLPVEATDIRWVMGYRKLEAIRMILDANGIHASDGDIEAIHSQFLQILNTYYETSELKEFTGISQLFGELGERGVQVALNTGFSHTTTAIIAERLGWLRDGLVRHTISSDQVLRGRPHSDMIHALMRACNVQNPLHVAKIGDTPSDLLEGHNAGCGLVIGVTYGTHTREELEVHPHHILVDHVRELRHYMITKWTEKTV